MSINNVCPFMTHILECRKELGQIIHDSNEDKGAKNT